MGEMLYTESIRGYPYRPKQALAEEFGISVGTVHNRLKGLEKEIQEGRYNNYALIRDGGLVLVNVLAFIDYLTYHQMLEDKNARKHTPPFKPDDIVRMIGWNNRIIREGD